MEPKQLQITGIGPKSEQGNVMLYTVQALPYHATKEWLEAQVKAPAIGDTLEKGDKGVVTLLDTAPKTAKAQEEQEQEVQKKSPSVSESASGSGSSQSDGDNLGNQYVANPVIVTAHKIVSVGTPRSHGGIGWWEVDIALDNGENVVADAKMLARYLPEIGDYWVIQQDGYIYLNPKDVFERKYRPVIIGVDLAKE